MPDKADVAMDGEIPLTKVGGSNHVPRNIEAQRLEAPPAGRQVSNRSDERTTFAARSTPPARTVAEQKPASRKRLFAQWSFPAVRITAAASRPWRCSGAKQTHADDCECADADCAHTRDAGARFEPAVQCGGNANVRRIADRPRTQPPRNGANSNRRGCGTYAADSRLCAHTRH